MVDSFSHYGNSDIWAANALAIASGLWWLTLEVVAQRAAQRPLACGCGYAHTGLKGPECGKPIG